MTTIQYVLNNLADFHIKSPIFPLASLRGWIVITAIHARNDANADSGLCLETMTMKIWNSLFTTKYIVFSESYSVSRNIYWMFIKFFRLVIGIHQTFTWIYHFEFIKQDIKIYIPQSPKAEACVKDYFMGEGVIIGVLKEYSWLAEMIIRLGIQLYCQWVVFFISR